MRVYLMQPDFRMKLLLKDTERNYIDPKSFYTLIEVPRQNLSQSNDAD